MVSRWRWVGLLAGLSAPLLASCPAYSPTLADCSVHCGPQQQCPSGYACKANWCRPVNAGGACDCKPGDQRTCGGGKGLCVAGVQTCSTAGTWGLCVGEGKPSAEICDGLDNDCDGLVDNDVSDAPVCPLKLGVCMSKVQVCVNGAFQGFCDATTYGPNYQVVETKCDGLDNDCDGVTDGTNMVPILTNVVAYDMHEVDAGYFVAASAYLDDGGYGMVLVQLDPGLKVQGSPIVVPGGDGQGPQYVAATSWGGVGYVTFSDTGIGSDVHVIALDPDGTVRPFKTVTSSELDGPLTIGVDGTLVYVAYVANNNISARLVTWPVVDGGSYTTSNFSGPPDPTEITVNTAVVSPHALATFWAGSDNDAGLSIYYAKQVGGTKVGYPPVSGNFKLDDTGTTVHSAWNENVNFSFFGITENYSVAVYKPDLFSASYGSTVRQFGDYTAINATNLGRGVNGAAMTWTEYNSRVAIGIPVGSGAQMRLRFITPDAGTATAGSPDIAYCGVGDMLAVTYLDGVTGIGNLYGQLVCPP